MPAGDAQRAWFPEMLEDVIFCRVGCAHRFRPEDGTLVGTAHPTFVAVRSQAVIFSDVAVAGASSRSLERMFFPWSAAGIASHQFVAVHSQAVIFLQGGLCPPIWPRHYLHAP